MSERKAVTVGVRFLWRVVLENPGSSDVTIYVRALNINRVMEVVSELNSDLCMILEISFVGDFSTDRRLDT
jgi:hypothetical protein